MSTHRLTPADAQTFWTAAKIPNDTFLLFGFAGVPADLDLALAEAMGRAAQCAELTVRVDDPGGLSYPAWAPCGVDPAQFVVHELEDATWSGCLAATVGLIDEQLDARVQAWRLHVFPSVDGVPGAAGRGTAAVLQISHALGGGGRTSVSAALMFGRSGAMPEVVPDRVGPARLPLLGFRAARAHRRLVSDTEAGLVPPPAASCPVLRTNARPSGVLGLRTVVLPRAELSRPTVTVAALAGIGEALGAHLEALGDDPATLGAELMIAKPLPRRAYNHFGTGGVGLHPQLDPPQRAERIAADVDARRERAAHPAMRASELAFAATPAPLLRWGVGQFDPDVRLAAVTGNTVVSSVNCGAADFAFGGATVSVAAAFAGLSPMMGLTHVVVGVGDTVTISVHAAESALGGPDGLDTYVARLEAALGA
ncbi:MULTISPECIES: WS/DGAT domain-containing protein [unclassified Mycobacterium]|uniref:WS/DGAT domain-containing protein n=1 Tax=unclassified Mycobacterium TaxID=2642494 RepID=UPI0029C94BCE|nr:MULTISPECIES: WS/DGAT domain-containing protein [unclassified Mycobacterium]